MNDTDKKRLEEIKAVVRKVQEEDEGSSFLAVPWGVEFLISHLTSALESIQRVRELHRRYHGDRCRECIDAFDGKSAEYPCETIRILDDVGSGALADARGAAAQEDG